MTTSPYNFPHIQLRPNDDYQWVEGSIRDPSGQTALNYEAYF